MPLRQDAVTYDHHVRFPFGKTPDPTPDPRPNPAAAGWQEPRIGELYPEFAPFTIATERRDWDTLRRRFAELPTDVDPTWAVKAATEVDGCEAFLTKLAKKERSSTLPRLLLGDRYITLAWEARTGKRAQYVSNDQFKVFFAYLQRAEKLLQSVTDDEPDNVAAWTTRITTARGLQLDVAEARRRYAMAAQAFPNPVFAQRQMLMMLCPKWYGTFPEVHAFARECDEAAPPGSINAAVVADGYVEAALDIKTSNERIAFLSEPRVVEALRAAADRSVSHPNFLPTPGWIWANSVFAYAFRFGGQYARALPLFQANGDRIVYPFANFKDPVALWRSARKFCQEHV